MEDVPNETFVSDSKSEPNSDSHETSEGSEYVSNHDYPSDNPDVKCSADEDSSKNVCDSTQKQQSDIEKSDIENISKSGRKLLP